MDALTQHVPELALSAALAWGAGLRLYLVLFLLGVAGHQGWVPLPASMTVLQSPLVLGASGFMAVVEFFADKIPWVDSVWDTVHTFIRIPAGAALAASVFGTGTTEVMAAAAILGGGIAAGSHFTKAGARAAINASPEPFTNWGASLAEDMMVPAGLWVVFGHPLLFLVLLAMFLLVAAFVLHSVVRGARRLLRPHGTSSNMSQDPHPRTPP
jgi:hypothetical protein